MIFVKPYSSIIIFYILLFIIAVSLLFSIKLNCPDEGFETVPFATDPSTKNITKGYYQVTNSKMAKIPYGFGIDPTDPKKIIPITKIGINMLIPRYNASIPTNGEKMPDRFYLTKYCVDTQSTTPTSTTPASTTTPESTTTKSNCSMYDMSLSILPPNMSPNLVKIDISGNPERILYYYDPGYISETQYYENIYSISSDISSLPKELYYTDKSRNSVSFLKYGQIQDPSNGYGAIRNPNLDLYKEKLNYQESGYSKIQNEFSVQFHDDIETIKKQNNLYDLNFGEVRVKDQNGNIVVLPRTNAQETVTYYAPGEFPFGASTYVPNYEDSVYLSSVGNRTPFGEVKLANCNGACKAYNEFTYKMSEYCDK
jgi:hypothetical protein